MNLIPHYPQPRVRRRLPWFVAVVGLLIALVGWFAVPAKSHEARALGVEEKEAIVLLLNGLENHYPEVASWIEETREIFVDESLPSLVEHGSVTGLVRYEDDTLLFSDRFFEVDSAAQEKALVEAVFAIKQASQRSEPEIAISVGD